MRNGACAANPATVESRALARFGDRREIDVGREVGESRPEERIVVRMVTVVAHQRPLIALRMVVLGRGKTVVDHQHRAVRDPPSHILDQRFRRQVDLAQVVALRRKTGGGEGSEPWLRGPLRPRERIARVIPRNPALEPCVLTTRDEMHGQRIQHLVREHRTIDGRRRRVEPGDTCSVGRCIARDRRALPLAQVRRRFDNRVARGKGVARRKRTKEVRREAPTSPAQLDDLAAGRDGEDLGDLAPERKSVQRRHLRRRDEVAGAAELGRAGGVVAEPRRVQRDLHVTVERKEAGARHDLRTEARDDARAVRGGIRIGKRQFGHVVADRRPSAARRPIC